MGDFFKVLFSRIVAIFLVLGVVIFGIAITNGLSYWHFNIMQPAKTYLTIVGVFFIVLGIVFAFIDTFSDRPFQIFHSKYGITIEHPTANDSYFSPITVRGKFKRMPPHGSVFGFELNPQTSKYWPKRQVQFNINDKTWSIEFNIGGGDDRPRHLKIIHASQRSLWLYEYFKNLADKGKFEALPRLPDGFREVTELRIILRTPTTSPSVPVPPKTV